MVMLSWAVNTSNLNVGAEEFIFEIQYLISSRFSQWEEFVRGFSPVSQVVYARGIDTVFRIRGRGYNSTTGRGDPSEPSERLFAYTSDSVFPLINSITGHPSGTNTLGVSWTVGESECYAYSNFSVVCEEESAENVSVPATKTAEGLDREVLFAELLPDTIYDCLVHGTISEKVEEGGMTVREDAVSESLRTFTLPEGESCYVA